MWTNDWWYTTVVHTHTFNETCVCYFLFVWKQIAPSWARALLAACLPRPLPPPPGCSPSAAAPSPTPATPWHPCPRPCPSAALQARGSTCPARHPTTETRPASSRLSDLFSDLFVTHHWQDVRFVRNVMVLYIRHFIGGFWILLCLCSYLCLSCVVFRLSLWKPVKSINNILLYMHLVV